MNSYTPVLQLGRWAGGQLGSRITLSDGPETPLHYNIQYTVQYEVLVLATSKYFTQTHPRRLLRVLQMAHERCATQGSLPEAFWASNIAG